MSSIIRHTSSKVIQQLKEVHAVRLYPGKQQKSVKSAMLKCPARSSFREFTSRRGRCTVNLDYLREEKFRWLHSARRRGRRGS